MWTADECDREPNDPTAAEIQAGIDRIQAQWTREHWIERRAGGVSARWLKNVAQNQPGTPRREIPG